MNDTSKPARKPACFRDLGVVADTWPPRRDDTVQAESVESFEISQIVTPRSQL